LKGTFYIGVKLEFLDFFYKCYRLGGRLKWRRFIILTFAPNPIDHRTNGAAQNNAQIPRVRPILPKQSIEKDNVRSDLFDLGIPGIVGALGRSDQKAKYEGCYRPDETGT
jgi:hypothetical protein